MRLCNPGGEAMSDHKKPMSPELRQALIDHHLATDTPSQLSDLFRHGWQAATAAAIPPDMVLVPIGNVVDRSVRYDADLGKHFPCVTVEFTPVPIGSKDDTGWNERDAFAAMLNAAKEQRDV